ncbi:hypothetical protein MRX96_033856 [Rhipicephalus microplus]
MARARSSLQLCTLVLQPAPVRSMSRTVHANRLGEPGQDVRDLYIGLSKVREGLNPFPVCSSTNPVDFTSLCRHGLWYHDYNCGTPTITECI